MSNYEFKPDKPDMCEVCEEAQRPSGAPGYSSEEHLQNVRRTLESGLKIAQSPPMDGTYIDVFTHALDELKASGLKFPEL